MNDKFYLILILFFTACSNQPTFDQKVLADALENGERAREGYTRSLKFVEGWLAKTDSTTGLIPTNLNDKADVWEPHNSAADNYPFMVLTTYLLDKELYNSKMLEMLRTERKLTSRIESLPDIWSFSKQNFLSEEVQMDQIIFGTSEYLKDGLMPLNEYIGHSPWQDRMLEMISDLSTYFVVMRESGKQNLSPALPEEINGEMLQILSRLFWMTGDYKYLDWAVEIGDYYLLGERDLTNVEYLSLRNHGCEVLGGLSELYVTLHFANPEKKETYKSPYYLLLDRILEIGRNEDGMFYNAVDLKNGEVVDSEIVDNWGYDFNAYYSVWLVDSTRRFREAVLDGIEKLNEKYRNYAWEGTKNDGYADALESGLNLYNRESKLELKKWIDSEIQVMFDMQQDNGIIEGWHGDGNFARTAIMYSLWKTQGAHIYPWRKDIVFGAEKTGNETYFVLTVKKDWKGKMVFDSQRHKTILNLPIDYPRINQFPEWFTVEETGEYKAVSSKAKITGKYSGKKLLTGLPIELNAGETFIISLQDLSPMVP